MLDQKHYEETEELISKINEIRERMCYIIQIKSNLIDPEIIEISQELDLILNRYHELRKL